MSWLFSLVTLGQGLGLDAAEDIPQRLGTIRLFNDILGCRETWETPKSSTATSIPIQTGIGTVVTQMRVGTGMTQLRVGTMVAQLGVGTVVTQMRAGAMVIQLGIGAVVTKVRI